MGDPFLTVQIDKAYSGFRLDLDVTLSRGITAIFGPSGSGKTTTLNCIAGLASPDAGEVVLEGRALFSSSSKTNLPPERRRVGYVFQDALLFPHLSVRENVWYGYRRTPAALRRLHPDALVDLLGVVPLLDRRPASLSGGERQRVALARSLAASPRVLLLDEPLASLDLPSRGRILRALKELNRELDVPMVYVSHSLSEVLSLADEALVMSGGRAVAQDAPYRVLHQPSVRPLVEPRGLETLLDVTVVGHRPRSGLTEGRVGDVPLWLPRVDRDEGAVLSVAVRAADVMLATVAPEGLSARNVLAATIQALDPIGDAVVVTADVGAPLLAEVTPEAVESLGLRIGERVYVVLKTSSIMVLD